MFIYVGLGNMTMGCPNLVQIKGLIWVFLHLVVASHGYILRAYMNEHTLLINVVEITQLMSRLWNGWQHDHAYEHVALGISVF